MLVIAKRSRVVVDGVEKSLVTCDLERMTVQYLFHLGADNEFIRSGICKDLRIRHNMNVDILME